MKKDENSPVGQHFDAMEQLRLVERDLEYIADSLFVIGLDNLAKTLMTHAKTIIYSQKSATSAFSRSINDRFKAAQESSANLLKAALYMGEKSKE